MKETIRNRHTLKVLANVETPWPVPGHEFDAVLLELIDLASYAPYHRPCDPIHQQPPLDSPAPWRFYVSNGANCRLLLEKAKTLDTPLGNVGRMLAAAHGLVNVTWLPDPSSDPRYSKFQSFEPTLSNMEHIAAVSAATQNLLLAATDAGLNNYWSSGGVVRTETVYEWIGIPTNQVLLGSIFLFPLDIGDAETKPGANRGLKGEASRWMRWTSL